MRLITCSAATSSVSIEHKRAEQRLCYMPLLINAQQGASSSSPSHFFPANWDPGVDKTFLVFNLTYLIIHLYPSLRVERTGGVVLNLSSLWSAIMVMIRRITWASGSMNWPFRQTKVMLWAWVRGGGFHLGKSPREWNKQHRLFSNKESI